MFRLLWLLPGALLLSACSASAPKADEPPVAVLCAAEALSLARQTELGLGEEDNLRVRARVFTDKLTRAEQERFRRKVDQLADGRAGQPLVAAATCDALLTGEDRRALAASAAVEANAHHPMPEVP